MKSPKDMKQMKGNLEQFQQEHPKIIQFLAAASQVLDEGSVIEVDLTTSEGKKLCTNMRVSQNDLALVSSLLNNNDKT